jgi:hypothetical protein
MATTTNNGWTTPDDTDLVKDGALAIRDLGQDIDTSVGTGLLAWTSYTPTITAATGTITSTTITRAKYAKLGKIVHLNIDFTITNNGTGAGSVFITLPSGVNAAAAFYHGVGRENNVSGGICNFFTLNTTQIRMTLGAGGYPGGTGYNLTGSITYETA